MVILRRRWAALGNLSLMDWIAGLFQYTLFGALASVYAWMTQLPIVLSGLIAFTCGFLVWAGSQILRLPHLTHAAGNSRNSQPAPAYVSPFSGRRISFVNFLDDAERRGVNFRDASHAISRLCKLLRQAGCDGALQFYGRSVDPLENAPPLLEIEKLHWRDFEIDWLPAFNLAGPNGGIGGLLMDNNRLVSSRSTANSNQRGYRDLHVHAEQSQAVLGEFLRAC